MKSDAQEDRGHTAIACHLSAGEFRRRAEELGWLFEDARQMKELEDGFGFEFSGDDDCARRLLELVMAERRCCPFLAFELAFEPNQGAVCLRLRGSAEVKTFLEAVFLQTGNRG